MPDPDFAYRTFYTWDHSTNWDLTQPVSRVGGCHEAYPKPPDAFLADYKTLVDAMRTLGLNHLIVWGALRDAHGGVDALRKLIDYASARNVRVAPGVGLYSYGGVYYEGDHEYSLNRLLNERRDLAAVDEIGRPLVCTHGRPRRSIACPRSEEVADWTVRSIDWLMREVAPPAVHLETGDYGTCHCARCRDAGPREKAPGADEMARMLLPPVQEIRRHAPDCWISYNYYYGYTREMMRNRPAFATALPDDVICKWGVSWMLEPMLRPRSLAHVASAEPVTPQIHPPTRTNMAHLHFGTGWWQCSPRGTLEITRFMRYVPLLHQVGFQGLCTHGEESSLNPPSELNYHVYAALAQDARATPQAIAQRSVGELYGSVDLAAEVLRAYRDELASPALCARVAREARKARGQRKVRLNWLTFALHRLAESSHHKRG